MPWLFDPVDGKGVFEIEKEGDSLIGLPLSEKLDLAIRVGLDDVLGKRKKGSGRGHVGVEYKNL